MSRLSLKLGFWSAAAIAAAFLVYTVGYVAILVAFRIPHWTSLADFAASINEPWYLLYTVCQLLAFVTAPLFVLLVNSLHDYAREDQKVLTRASLCFAIIFAVLSSLSYFVQFGAVRQSLVAANPTGIEPFVQLNPLSVVTSLNILGWSLFLGLSSLLLVPLFSGGRLAKVIKYAFLANGVFCLLGAVGYVFGIYVFNLLFFDGMGLSVIVIALSSSLFFRRLEKSASL